MDVMDISVNGKFKLAKWISKRYRKLCISELIRNSKDEHQLFAMCEYIDRWYDEHMPSLKPLEAPESTEEDIEAQEDQEVSAPATVMEVGYVVPEKHTRLKQHNFSRHVTHRLNVFITNNPEVSISKIIAEAATEDDLMRAMDEIETKKKVVDPRIKRWTVRRLS